MRKQPAFLEHIADAPAPGRHVDARRAVEQHVAVERDAAAVGPQQAGDHVDDAGLAGAGRPEQRGRAAVGRERGVERELAELLFDVDRQHAHAAVTARAQARRANHSDAISAASEMIDRDDHQRQRGARRRPAPAVSV